METLRTQPNAVITRAIDRPCGVQYFARLDAGGTLHAFETLEQARRESRRREIRKSTIDITTVLEGIPQNKG